MSWLGSCVPAAPSTSCRKAWSIPFGSRAVKTEGVDLRRPADPMADGKEAPQFPLRPYTDERGWWDGSIPRFCPLIIRVRVFNTEALPFRMIMTYLPPPFSVARLSYMLQDVLG